MRKLSIFLIFLISFASVAGDQDGDSRREEGKRANQGSGVKSSAYYSDRERGWFWYEDPAEDENEPEKKEDVAAGAASAVPDLSPREVLKKQGEQWEDAMAKTILNPTNENYQNYLALTTKIQQQSQDFAAGFRQAIWTNPEYDYTLKKPQTTQAIIANNDQELKLDERELYRLSERNGLIFFFRGDCPFCHRFAPVLRLFSEKYGFTVIPVSLDGGGLPEYPYPKRDYDMGRKLEVKVVPALFMVNPTTNKVSVVGYGFADWSKLVAKVLFAGKQIEDTGTLKVGDSR